MDVSLDVDEVPINSCKRSDEFELTVPKVFEITSVKANTNGLYLVLTHGGNPHDRVAFGSLVLIPRYGSKPICTSHNSSGETCPCIKLLYFLQKNDNFKLRESCKRNHNVVNTDLSIEHDELILTGSDESRLFSNRSTKPRPLQNPSNGHKVLTVASYKYLMDPAKEVELTTQKGCTCALVESTTGLC